jgi:hypothetical protein
MFKFGVFPTAPNRIVRKRNLIANRNIVHHAEIGLGTYTKVNCLSLTDRSEGGGVRMEFFHGTDWDARFCFEIPQGMFLAPLMCVENF